MQKWWKGTLPKQMTISIFLATKLTDQLYAGNAQQTEPEMGLTCAQLQPRTEHKKPALNPHKSTSHQHQKFNGKLARGKTTRTRTRMSSPTDMEHPYHQLSPTTKIVLLLTRKTHSTEGESVVLRCLCPCFPEHAHFGVPTEYASSEPGVGSHLVTSIFSSTQK